MPHHTKKHKSHRRSTKKYSKRPTIREHGFRIVRHNLPSKGSPRSMKNIHRSVYNLPSKSVNRSTALNTMNVTKNVRASIPRSSKASYQAKRNEEKMVEQWKKNEREERKEQKAAHSASMANLNAMMGKFHF